MKELEKEYYTLVYKIYINREKIFELIEKPIVKEYLDLLDKHMYLDYELKKSIKQNLSNYDEVKESLTKVDEKISELMEDSLIIEYNDEMKKQTILDYELKKVDFNLKKELYSNCDHLFIKHNQYKDGNSEYCCLRCGYDVRVKGYDLIPISNNEYQNISNDKIGGIFINEFTDLNLAHRIYDGIIDAHPDISNEDLSKYFRVARHFILEKGERNYDKHAKHLGLQKQRY